MSVVIRLTRMGKKGERKFRIIAKEKRSKRDGKAIEILGWYEKGISTQKKQLNKDRIKYWISQGAEVTKTVSKLLE
ncbi:MAG: 30S ribosomal protein S16 [Candidatus Levyibacteriota bacterium]